MHKGLKKTNFSLETTLATTSIMHANTRLGVQKIVVQLARITSMLSCLCQSHSYQSIHEEFSYVHNVLFFYAEIVLDLFTREPIAVDLEVQPTQVYVSRFETLLSLGLPRALKWDP